MASPRVCPCCGVARMTSRLPPAAFACASRCGHAHSVARALPPRRRTHGTARRVCCPPDRVPSPPTGGCGAKFDIVVISDALPPSILERHRLVQRILKDELAGVHATTIKTLTVAQAAARRAAGTL